MYSCEEKFLPIGAYAAKRGVKIASSALLKRVKK
jgi:hypothetical protein